MKKKQENYDSQNLIPLSGDEIKSILKSQSESVFEDKNISNNSNFVKKSLIDIALDFKSNQKIQEEDIANKTLKNSNDLQDEIYITKDEEKVEDTNSDENKETENKKHEKVETSQSNNQEEENNINEVNLDKAEEDIQSEKLLQDSNNTDVESDKQEQQNVIIADEKSDGFVNSDNETQQALDSVRDAVSQSINKSEDEAGICLEENKGLKIDVSEKINKDIEDFNNILSSLTTLTEEAIYEVFQNKILEISYELAGYQIDKIPEKYEKKIKSFLKNINCYQDKITIEVNDKDFEALSKIKNFNKNEEKKVFIPNKELSRGDIILNCDGMSYSEKSNYST